jgi:hypothetical protein
LVGKLPGTAAAKWSYHASGIHRDYTDGEWTINVTFVLTGALALPGAGRPAG